jgi:hypothetical protein
MILSKMITLAMATRTFFEVGPRRIFLLGFLGSPGFRSTAGQEVPSGKG